MARYTEYVYEILQRNALPDERVTDLTDMTAIAYRTLFKDAPLNVLSSLARENFVTQFTLHYFKDEIGLETLTLWRFALAEKLYNNAEYINGVYQNLAKQAYTEYESRVSASNGTRTEVGTINNTRTDNLQSAFTRNLSSTETGSRTNTGTQTDNATTGNLRTNNLSDTTRETGTDTLTKTGTDTLANTGSQTRTDDLTDATTFNTSDAKTLNLSDATTYGKNQNRTYSNYNEHIARNGNFDQITNTDWRETTQYGKITNDLVNREQDTSNKKNYEIEHGVEYKGGYTDSNQTKNDTNAMSFTFDTPQGSLEDLRDPGGVPGTGSGAEAVGKGIAYATGQEYNYFSAAGENDGTTWIDGKNTRLYGVDGKNDGKYQEVTKDKYDIDGTTNFDKTELKTKSGTNTATIDGTTYSGDLQHTTGQDTTTRTGSQTHSRNDTEDKTMSGAIVDSMTGTDTTNRTGTDTNLKTGTESTGHTGTSTVTDDKHAQTTYNTESTDTKNLSTATTRTGTVNDSGSVNRTVTDNLNEATQNSRTDTGTSTTTNTGTQTDNKAINGNKTLQDSGTEEIYKIDFLKWAMQPRLLDKVWTIFDDLFMWLYN